MGILFPLIASTLVLTGRAVELPRVAAQRLCCAYRSTTVAAVVLLILTGIALAVDGWVCRVLVSFNLPGELRRLLSFGEIFGHGLGVACVLSAVWMLDRRGIGLVWRLALCSYAAGLAADVLKLMLPRQRPLLSNWTADMWDSFCYGGSFPSITWLESDFQSFPSGHAATAVGLAIALSSVYPRGRWLFFGFAACACLQRIWVSVHYPSDVLAGAMIGCLVAGHLAERLRLRAIGSFSLPAGPPVR